MNGNDALLNNVPILGGILQRFNLNEGDQSNAQNKSEKPIEELLIKSYSTGLLEDPNLLRTFEHSKVFFQISPNLVFLQNK